MFRFPFRARRLREGFTLLELLFVTVIIGILIGTAWPLLQKSYDDFLLKNSVRKTYYMFCYLQGAAISESRVYCLNVSIDEGKGFEAFYRAGNGFQPISDMRFKRFSLPRGIEMTMDPRDRTMIYFYPDGSIDGVNLTFTGLGQQGISLVSEGLICEVKAS